MWSNKRIFISGGNGVIGRELVNKLHSLGAKIMVGDLKPFSCELPQGIVYRQGDLNYSRPEELLAFKPEYFFHLAATFERSIETYDFWEENFWHNIRLSHHLMTIFKDCPTLKRVVFASSYLIYDQSLYQFGEPQQQAKRLKEQDAVCPRNLTGIAKLLHEMELRFLAGFNEERLSVVMPRIYRVYGQGSKDVISRWARQLLGGEDLTVYRKEGMFDYIYASDVAEGLVRLAETDYRGVINLGKDNARKVEDVLKAFSSVFGDFKAVECTTEIPFEASQANMDLFSEVTGWKPAVEIEEGILKVIEYEKKFQTSHSDDVSGNVLVTSASSKVRLVQTVKNAMDKLGFDGKLIAADSNSACLTRYFATDFWHMPPLAQLTEDLLLSELKQRGVRYIIPSRDGELIFWSEKKSWLKQNSISIMVSDADAIDICIDKLAFYRKCLEIGIPAIATDESLDQLIAQSYVVKERYGAGARNIGLNLNWEQASEHARELEHPIFQPYIAGQEYSIDAYVNAQGSVQGLIIRTRDVVVSGESKVTTTVIDPDLENFCTSFIEKLGLYGHIVLQLIIDDQGDIWMLECNARFGGASTLSVTAGLDSFYWFFLEAGGNSLSDYPFFKNNKILRQVRYPADQVEEVQE